MKRFMPLIMVLAILAVGSWAFAQDSIKIGVVGPRTGPAAATGKAFEEGIACLMAHKSYVEKRRVEWDPVNRKIV